MNKKLVPKTSILIGKQDWLAGRPGSGLRSRSLDLHQCNQSVYLGLIWRQFRENAPEPEGLLAKCRPHPVLSSRGRIAFVEDQVNHRKHRRQARGKVLSARHFKRNLLFGKRSLGPDNALRDRALRYQESTRNLVGSQASQ